MLNNKALLEERFHKLLAANGAALSRLAASYTNSRSDRDDLFQDIALPIWKALPQFRGESSERTFIFRVAHNRAITYISQRKPITASPDEIEVADPGPNPEKGFAREQQESRLFEAIHRLPLHYRQVITLALEDMTYTEIADVIGISETKVGVRMNRARQMLREMLEVTK
jgi:RNA polymerase sigma factor (sigma-70 family)